MLTINNIKIDNNSAPLIIPEIGINHSGILENAFKIVDSAKRAGAKIIKTQTHIPDKHYFAITSYSNTRQSYNHRQWNKPMVNGSKITARFVFTDQIIMRQNSQ